ncbi:Major facilitator superfamily protein [Theobroma cacao]|uniref:Major facilitator superfamily protein n=1 Tax=Theobroma cacao TaxID=3641 RepID=A0A061FJ26_THECC|nr:Major facilitator superfamily protein [Theobroma cacao]
MSISVLSGAETPLLEQDTIDGYVGCNGRPVARAKSGGWRSASFIIGIEVAERFAYFGIESNLISYLTGPLGQSTAAAAEQVNAWSGTAMLLPLLGGFVADSFLGRYRTIIVASLLYVLGLSLLTVTATLPSVNPSGCQNTDNFALCSSQFQEILFFFALFLVALGQGGQKPCVQAFGADQFDTQDPEECKAKSSFFNWWYFCLCTAMFITHWVLNYIQDNLSWVLGFGIPCVMMVVALVVFLCGTTTYRFSVKGDKKNPFVRIGEVYILAARNWNKASSAIAVEEELHGNLPTESSNQFKFLNKALLASDGLKEHGQAFSIREVEEAKAVLRLVPIWFASLVYAVVFAQSSTFFVKQGATMNRSITAEFKISSASLQSFASLASILFIPIYDRIFVPLTRGFTRKPAGITMLQRIGIGMLLSAVSIVIAALVEMQRLMTAQKHGLVDKPDAMVPMSVWWLVPSYVLFGLSDVFTMVGLQEFFYDQVPNELRSVGLSLYLSIFGVGSFLSSFLISAIENATGGNGQDSWFADNLNRAHLDYFYWLLAALSAIQLALYLYFTKSYIYNKGQR